MCLPKSFWGDWMKRILHAEEDYLKLIYELTYEANEELTKPKKIAEIFNYSEQSVNEMIKKLLDKELVEFYPYKGVKLTEKGRHEAIRMIRIHRILEVFLIEKLGFEWQDVHEEVENLEHAVSEEMIERLNKYLGYPQYCPHGNPIPTASLKPVKPVQSSLNEADEGVTFKLLRVNDHKALLQYLNEQNIHLHDEFTVLSKDDLNKLIWIEGKNGEHVVSYHLADMIFGEIR